MKSNKGFTLIELLIVIGIIGILAAIAVVIYQEYSLKSKVSEAASLSAPSIRAIDIAHSEGYALGDIPSAVSLGLNPAGSYHSKYVSSVAVDATGRVTVQLSNEASLGVIANRQIIYVPTNSGRNLTWQASCDFTSRYCPKN